MEQVKRNCEEYFEYEIPGDYLCIIMDNKKLQGESDRYVVYKTQFFREFLFKQIGFCAESKKVEKNEDFGDPPRPTKPPKSLYISPFTHLHQTELHDMRMAKKIRYNSKTGSKGKAKYFQWNPSVIWKYCGELDK